MKPTVFVYGPRRCGKTQNAERLRVHFGLDLVIDNWATGQPRPPAWGALVLTNLDGGAWAETRGYPAVEYSRVVFSSPSERRERIATAVLAGLASIPFDNSIPYNEMPSDDARRAIAYADALIAELDK